MGIEMFGKISDAFGPSGFEEEVVRTVAGYCGKYQVENDAMNNLYVRMPGRAGDKPVVQLDAHLDECGFMVQCIHDNGCLGILMLGGFHLTNLPAHTVIIKTRAGRKIRGIIMSKPVHFMNDKERASLELSQLAPYGPFPGWLRLSEKMIRLTSRYVTAISAMMSAATSA